jgi:TRAP-type C4-dicarboxylate transport system substrate-binding protein
MGGQGEVLRLGGYGPPDSTHGRGLARIAELFRRLVGAEVDVEIEYNVLDAGRQASDLLDEVEAGGFTLCYFSTSYLSGRVPDLGIVDLPYLFKSLEHAHRVLDGELGHELSERTSRSTGLVPLAYWDNGIRHLSNRVRSVLTPEDCAGLRIRLQPSWAHESYFRALGAVPVCVDLRHGIEMLRSGAVDAQENPLANFAAYGVHRLHRHLTLTAHAYGARGLYASARQLAGWPEDHRRALAQAASQAAREQRTAAEKADLDLEAWLEGEGCSVVRLTSGQRSLFEAAAEPVLELARRRLDARLFDLAGDDRAEDAG